MSGKKGILVSKRLHSLDALRTIAAMAVVLAHWPQHFFSVHEFAQPLIKAPFYRWLSEAYIYGPTAVTFFFCLSGFIFYWLYSDAVHAGQVSIGRYALLRFSRLYPLHLAMLTLLVPLVLLCRDSFGFDFVYQNNDLYHFALNLAFVQFWGLESGYSWNGPSWSISVEIALYITFFIACRMFRPGPVMTIGFTLVALALAPYSPIAQGAVAFFIGGLTFYGLLPVLRYRRTSTLLAPIVMLVIIWMVMVPLSKMHLITVFSAGVKNLTPSGMIGEYLSDVTGNAVAALHFLVPFSSLIFAAALLEAATPAVRWQTLAGIGDISFGVYLIHFPLQLITVLLALWFSMPDDTFTKPSIFFAFLAILLTMAFASYHWLERPAMRALRGIKLGSNAGVKARV